MNFEELKKIIQENNGEKFIILNSGNPSLVLMSFKEYKKLLNNNSRSLNEKIKREEDDLTIDDLPIQ